MQPKNTICLWFNGTALDAARFYAETFPDSAVGRVMHAPGDYPSGQQGDVLTVGVCVSSIQEGVGLSQSTVSDYLATLQRAGLVEVRRIGQWTYYKRNEANIKALAEIIGREL